MRWSSLFAASLLAAGLVLSRQPLANSANQGPAPDVATWAAETATDGPPPAAKSSPSFDALRATLTPQDPVAVLEAVGYALGEVADGATYIWHRKDGQLQGAVRPITSFRDASGAICRRLGLTLTLGDASRWADIVACRDGDGHWVVGG